MNIVEITGKTKEEALAEALRILNCANDEVTVKILDLGSKGILGIGAKPIKLRVTKISSNVVDDAKVDVKEEAKVEAKVETKAEAIEANVRANVEAKVEKSIEKPTTKDDAFNATKTEALNEKALEINDDVNEKVNAKVNAEVIQSKSINGSNEIEFSPADRIRYVERCDAFLKDFVPKLGDFKYTINMRNNELHVNIEGENSRLLIGKHGETLNSLQYILSIVVNKGEDKFAHIIVDSENYRKRRQETLEKLANNIATNVIRTKQKVVLEPTNAYERRIIHTVLQDNKRVKSTSEGEGSQRHIVISLR